MIELNSVWGVLLIEGFMALALLVIVFLLLSKKKKAAEHTAAYDLIDKLEESKNVNAKKLRAMILEHCAVEQDVLTELLGKINQNEQQLYKQILRIFLNRDMSLLDDLDQHIAGLSEPYFKMLEFTSSKEAVSLEKQEKQSEDKAEVERLMRINKKLGEQLSEAMATTDEVLEEYTRVFSGTQTELELENSSKKMLEIFRYAEQRVKSSIK